MEDDYNTSGHSEDEEDYYSSDGEAESLDGLENDDSDAPWVSSKSPSSKREDLRRVMDLLSVREHHARTLLIHHRWDVEKLIAVYVEKGKACMFAEAGVTVVVDLDPQEPTSTVMCNICWTEHFIVQIKDGHSKRIRCMAHKCNAICDDAIIRKLVSTRHPDLAEKFERFLLESYIEDNKMVKWCPRATGRDHTWSTIANHSCGRYKEDGAKKAERAKRDLYRYMHYHNRYKAHTDSFKQESRLRETIKEKVSHLEARDSKLRDFSWVTNGLYRLFRSRRALSYSYPFAFYMFGDDLFKDEMTEKEREIKQHLFEDQQQQLESNVEKLSKFLEEPFDVYSDEQIMEIRMQVINLSVITDSLCKKMYECIENDLLGSLQFTIHIIAPYQSKGIEKAEELTIGLGAQASSNNKCQKDADQCTGGVITTGQASGSRTSDKSIQYSRKRARKGSSADSVFDLNLPAEGHKTNP
ncbi:hypothetical protein DH2020_023851 [Rehmannia glutinosa]|uniref:Uncharacterized protein n=1 Tax=Rehmannia glutinosa TaxID=99300 RepID=A0ABR0W7X4_REHGL